jgi:hypothetical protein
MHEVRNHETRPLFKLQMVLFGDLVVCLYVSLILFYLVICL